MKSVAIVLALAGMALAQEAARAQQPAPGKAQAVKVRATTASRTELPANAQKLREGVWTARDASGKVWYYTRSPFGYMRMDEAAYQQAAKASEAPGVSLVAIEGETAKFERASPFGKSVWSRKVSELTEEERAVYEKQKNAGTGKQ
ncbi:MAG: hypothetical protein HY858_03375 [Candidatus Solibacter usitatus]|nr:hypothetical protein [Candidatus Solibacter usitatus]